MNYSHHRLIKTTIYAFACSILCTCGDTGEKSDINAPQSCIEGNNYAKNGDAVSAILSWKRNARDLSLKEASRKVLFCLPSFLYTDDRSAIMNWLRFAANSKNADVEAISGSIFLSYGDNESDIREGLSLLRSAADKGHDGAQFALYLYERS